MAAYVYKKRPNGRWYIGYRGPNGKPLQSATWVPTKREAQMLANEMEIESERIRSGLRPRAPARMLFADFADKYLTDYAAPKRGFVAIRSRIRIHLVPAFGGLNLNEISAQHIQAFLTSKLQEKDEAKKLSPVTVELLRVTLQGMLNVAIVWKLLLPPNPVGDVQKVKTVRRDPRFLELDEVPRLLAATPPEWRAMVATAICTGLRKGEIIGLRREDVDLARGIIRVRHSYASDFTKGGKPRTVALPAELVPALTTQLALKTPFVFPGQGGGMLPHQIRFAEMVREWAAIAGIERYLQFKDLRSTFGTHAVEQVGLWFVQNSLGHSNPETTKHYASPRGSHLTEGAKLLRFGTADPALTHTSEHNPETTKAGGEDE